MTIANINAANEVKENPALDAFRHHLIDLFSLDDYPTPDDVETVEDFVNTLRFITEGYSPASRELGRSIKGYNALSRGVAMEIVENLRGNNPYLLEAFHQLARELHDLIGEAKTKTYPKVVTA
jgi:hypothetical protein